MDAEVVAQLMVSHQLLSKNVFMTASSDYQKKCIILQQFGMMNLEKILSFSNFLLTNDSQKDIGQMLIKGKK